MPVSKRSLRKKLKQHRGSSKRLAQELGVKQSMISNWLSERTVSVRLDSELPAALDRVIQAMEINRKENTA